MMSEADYRNRVDDAMRRIDSAFEDIDPDLAESDYTQGSLVITLPQALKIIISPQTPVRQIWVAFRDRAWHLNQIDDRWLDDRGGGTELYTLVAAIVREHAGITLPLGA
jgi:iron donor protein CyaY